MQDKSINTKMAIFQIKPVPQVYGEVTLKLESLIPLFKHYASFLKSFDTEKYIPPRNSATQENTTNSLKKASDKFERGLDLICSLLLEVKQKEASVERQNLVVGLNMHNILIDIVKLIAAKRTEALEWVSKGAYSKGENTDT